MIGDIIPASEPGDPYFTYQYYLKNSSTHNGIHVDINVEPAWDAFSQGDGVTVAVLDDGVDGSHPDLGAPLAAGGDRDFVLNGYCSGDALAPDGNDFHGTAVAGIVAAQHDSTGTVGIAPDVTLNVARIYCMGYQHVSYDSVAAAIDWAWDDMESDVIINSWSLPIRSMVVEDAIETALTYGRGGLGTVVVFSAGNTGDTVTFPALLSSSTGVISVGAIDRYGDLTSYSPQEGPIDLLAPTSETIGACGGDLYTVDLYGSGGCDDGPGGDDDYMSSFGGTSAAAPQVGGAAALLLAKEPDLHAGQVKQRLGDFADDWGSGNEYGDGKLNVYAALLGALSVGINGENLVPENDDTCYWEAYTGPNSTGPFTFTWYKDGAQIDTGDVLHLDDTGEDDFQLIVTVTNPYDEAAADTMDVTVAPFGQAPPCPPY